MFVLTKFLDLSFPVLVLKTTYNSLEYECRAVLLDIYITFENLELFEFHFIVSFGLRQDLQTSLTQSHFIH